MSLGPFRISLLSLFFFMVMGVPLNAQISKSGIEGIWLNQERTAKISIETNNKNTRIARGYIFWLKHPKRNGKIKVDINNPNQKLRNRELLGLNIMPKFVYNNEEKRWVGEIYDPVSGLTYDCYIKKDKDKLIVRGYIGFEWIGRSATWTRSSITKN